MKTVVSGQWSVVSSRQMFFGCLLLSAFCLLACSVPNLESQECADARVVARKFYSFHFANEMTPSPENLKARERYLTPEYYVDLSSSNGSSPVDPFTNSDVPPNTFRIGKCVATTQDAGLEVQLYWRTDQLTTQKAIGITLIKTGDQWLIKHVGTLF